MQCALTESFSLGSSRRRRLLLLLGHLGAGLAVLQCSLPVAAAGLVAIGTGWHCQRRWHPPEALQRDAAGTWWLLLAGRRHELALLAAGPLAGVTCVTTTGQSELLFDDAFHRGELRRLRALLRHQGRVGA